MLFVGEVEKLMELELAAHPCNNVQLNRPKKTTNQPKEKSTAPT